jgi:flagellar L-ring protein precursor FlgH
MRKLCVFLIILILANCNSTIDRVKHIGREPTLQPVQNPQYREQYKPVAWSDFEERSKLQPKQPNSLWQPGARTFFRDQRARRVGDILKVNINIKDTADLDNKTEQVRKNTENLGITNLFGVQSRLKKLAGGTVDPSKLVTLPSDRDLAGNGTISRKESIKTQVAAMVTQILPNGNLVIHGHQEVRVNFELREILVEGIVRSEDISSDNSVDSDQIAEARISYGGRGQIMDMQQPRYGSQILDIILPF